ncbi:hypothetical protein EPO34_02740 [Patescibacteria group bacterium]|nr:MAG: hypothetical protein EPO34_02740 [Patescibacteria group bacterium]
MKLIVDAGPVIVLSQIGRIDILPEFFDPVVVPREVAHELARPGDTRPGSGFVSLPWVRVEHADPRHESLLPPAHGLHRGEASALILAVQALQAGEEMRVLIDDAAAVKAATALGVPFFRVGNLLVHAAQEGVIDLAAAEAAVRQLAACRYIDARVERRLLADLAKRR